ncbi:MAG: sulfatase [Pseudomonadota bacterium]|nr:sulfatase [Pseudomonadota bacterium]
MQPDSDAADRTPRPHPTSSPDRPPNILLVSMDTVRADRTSLGAARSGRDTTPNLAALASVGVSWTNAYAVANESLTSHAALFSGRYPSEVALPDYASFALPAAVPTLASVLRAYGYATAAFTGGGHVVADFGFDHGFGRFESVGADDPRGGRFGSFFDTVPPARAWMHGQGDAPWFAFVHGYDAHTPYVQRGPMTHLWGREGATDRVEALLADPGAVEQLRGRTWFQDRAPTDFTHAVGRTVLGTDFYRLPATPRPGERHVTLTDAEVAHLRDHYDTGLTYADVWLGVLLAGVDLSRTLVIVVSDHGEDLLDHGYANHRAGLWDSTLHVPLVVAGPGFGGGERSDGRVDLRSVVPTVLRAIGGALPAGVSAPALQDRPDAPVLFAEGVMDQVSAWDGAVRLTLDDVGLARGAPDLATRALDDRATLTRAAGVPADLADADARAEAARLRERVVAWRAGLVPATEPGVPVPDALRAALRERGYWTPE